MKILLTFLFSFLFVVANSQTTGNPTQIPFSDPDLNRPGGGAEQWTQGQNVVNIPVQGTNTQRLYAYYRFQWSDIQPSNSAGPGQCDFRFFDQQVNDAISKGQLFSFGIMPNCCSGPSVGGAAYVYPLALHNLMQAEAHKDWINGGAWYENPNSANWLTWFQAIHSAINTHIQNTSFNGVRYRDVVKRIDVRVLGDFGEQAVLNPAPDPLSRPTDASTIALVDAIVQGYPNIKCVAMVGSFGANTGVGISSAAVGKYELTTSNNTGVLGWRWDSWGWTDGYMHSWLENNPNVVAGFHFDTAIMNRYKYAPVCGEPADLGAAGNFGDLPVRVLQYHAQSFGNGNLDVNQNPNTTIQNNFRLASKEAGYRIILSSWSVTTTPQPGGTTNISLNWKNYNGVPCYEDYKVLFEWRRSSDGAVLQRDTSSFNMKYFYQTTDFNVSENFTMRTVPAGTADLYVRVVDPVGFRIPMPLFITGRDATGSYLIRSNITIAASGATANAGPNQNILISSVNLTAAGSVGANAYAWTLISGPNTPTITTPANVTTSVTGLITGTYVFRVCINGGPCSGQLISTVTIVVNAPALQANAGSNQTISLPQTSTTLNGSGSTGTITSYLWTNVSGPNTPTFGTATAVSTTVNGLIAGTYVFNLSINGGASTSNVSVTVLAAPVPVANAGINRTYTIVSPATTVTGNLDGTSSTGNITSYTWTKVSGPAGETITTPNAATSTVTGLSAGTYIFQLALNGGSTSTVQFNVNPPVPPLPSTATIFTTQTPTFGTQNGNVHLALTVGVKFRTSQALYITAIRYYRELGNNAAHIGLLYKGDGTLLASADGINPTTYGWITIQFATPVPILANTTYVAAVWNSNEFFSWTPNYFTSAVVTAPFTALANGFDGPNGVYIYNNSPTFPNVSGNGNNYWIDVVGSLTNPGATPKHIGRTIYFIERLNL